jgi:hypothetical protein
MQKECLVQLKTGDAIRGVTTRLWWWFRYLKVQNCSVIEVKTGKISPADGVILVPKQNVMFIQQLLRVVA